MQWSGRTVVAGVVAVVIVVGSARLFAPDVRDRAADADASRPGTTLVPLRQPRGDAAGAPSRVKTPRPGPPGVAASILTERAKLAAESITADTAKQLGFTGRNTPWVHIDRDLRVQSYIYTTAQGDAELRSLAEHGVEVELVSNALQLVQGWVPLAALEHIAQLSFVVKLTPPRYALVRAGSVVTQGDAIVRANLTRAQFGLDGTGVRVGVISDGANHRAAAAALGELPPNVVAYGSCSTRQPDGLQCDPGRTCNEGTAMLEIIHDIAPGAQLAIGSVNTSAEFIQRIDDLKNDFDADVIVDDVGFLDEPWFADGPIAAKVASVATQLIYVSAAGNSGRGHYEDEFFPQNDFHDFGSRAGGTIDLAMDIEIAPGRFVLPILQWNDPFGGSANDYDLELRNSIGTQLLCANCDSLEIQDGSQDPIEGICFFNSSASPVVGTLTIEQFDGSSRRLELMVIGGRVLQYNNPEGGIFGHPAAPGAVSVGAIDASDPGNDDIETFSSRGPSRIDFPNFHTRPTPTIAAIDGVSVSGTGGFVTQFFGTSAAAPHVAGVAALLRQALPGFAPHAVVSAMTSSAVDLGTTNYDPSFGAGRVDAFAATLLHDSDHDGVVDSRDAFHLDPNEHTDSDHDGTGDNGDAFPNDPTESRDTDHDGIGDNADPDDDNDGSSDEDDPFPLDSTRDAKTDGDGDGSLDVNDPFPADPTRTDDTDGATMFAAILPSSRSVQINTQATVFATVINASSELMRDCTISLATPGFDAFNYQTTDSTTNALTGNANTPADIVAAGAQSFVLALRPNTIMNAVDVPFRFDCANSKPVAVLPGINTLLVSASATPGPDIIALVATQTGDGIVHLPSANGVNAFAMATVNVGATGMLTASADAASLPLNVSICATDLQGTCAAPPSAELAQQISGGATPTFSVFVTATGAIALDPALHRIVVRFRDGTGVIRGSSSVAVRTLP